MVNYKFLNIDDDICVLGLVVKRQIRTSRAFQMSSVIANGLVCSTFTYAHIQY